MVCRNFFPALLLAISIDDYILRLFRSSGPKLLCTGLYPSNTGRILCIAEHESLLLKRTPTIINRVQHTPAKVEWYILHACAFPPQPAATKCSEGSLRARVRGCVGKGAQEGGGRLAHRNRPDVRRLLRCGSLPRPRHLERARQRRARGGVEVGQA